MQLRCLKLIFIIAIIGLFAFVKTTKQASDSLKGFIKQSETVTKNNRTIEESFYDSLGRIIKGTGENNAFTALFSYPSKQKILFDVIINNTKKLQVHRDIFLNSNYRQDSIIQIQYSDDVNDTTIEKFFYNNKKLVVKHNSYSVKNQEIKLLEYTTYLYDSIGNVLEENTYDDNMFPKEALHYTYTKYSNNINIGAAVFMHINPNLTLKKQLFDANNNLIETTDFFYTFDNRNMLVTEVQKVRAEIMKTINYTYY